MLVVLDKRLKVRVLESRRFAQKGFGLQRILAGCFGDWDAAPAKKKGMHVLAGLTGLFPVLDA